ncbi:fasciclin-1 [Tetranychus urticae]|uniref:FAS1 domain-containing protein n=1 Tax=Tetranychus urticae TaxID=32264 RepID=T1KTB7_TETUR|nr:fasciclin-1 [Tetranychus urticae]
MFTLSLFLCFSLLTQVTLGQVENIYGWAQKSGKYSEWIKQVDKSDANYKPFVQNTAFGVTAFIPTNDAFGKFSEPSNDIISSHLVFGSFDADTLLKIRNKDTLDSTRSRLRFSSGFDRMTNRSAIFVLDARILESHKVGNSMVHIIDRVLNLPKSRDPVAPNALEWIKNRNIYPSVSVRGGVDSFADFIERKNVTFQFSNCAECTFFVPENIDSKTAAKIDANVLLGHVIPNQILFLRSMNNSTPYKTKADSSNLTVELYKEERSDSGSMKSFIYSNTKGSISTHLGNTRVKITRANIPVNNGVIHIIEKPLVITDMSILDYLNEESGTSLSKFYTLLQDFPSLRPVYSRGESNTKLTLFAFTNEAYESVKNDIAVISKNRTAMEDLMKLHFADHKTINSQNAGMIKEAPSLAPSKKLHFSVDRDRLYVEGDGVKAATVLQDISCTNGVIHVINKVLGIPSSPIKDKLREDPQLKTTFTVAEKMRSDWLARLGDKSKNFTFFAPSEAAWKKLHDEDPSSYKQLVDGLYADNAMNILNRHLVERQAISLENLSTMKSVQTVNSQLMIETKASPSGQTQVVLKFMQLKSTIVRPDIKAINGYIHEIDTILMQDVDLTVQASAVRGSSSISRISPAIIIFSIAAYILKLF